MPPRPVYDRPLSDRLRPSDRLDLFSLLSEAGIGMDFDIERLIDQVTPRPERPIR